MKNIKIPDETHRKMKVHCGRNGLQLGPFADQILARELKKLAPTRGRPIKTKQPKQEVANG